MPRSHQRVQSRVLWAKLVQSATKYSAAVPCIRYRRFTTGDHSHLPLREATTSEPDRTWLYPLQQKQHASGQDSLQCQQASLTCLEISSSLGLHASCWEAVRGEVAGLPKMSARATCSEGADPMALVWGACRAARDHSRSACVPHLSFRQQRHHRLFSITDIAETATSLSYSQVLG